MAGESSPPERRGLSAAADGQKRRGSAEAVCVDRGAVCRRTIHAGGASLRVG